MEHKDIFSNRIRELAALSWRRGIAIFSDFLDLYEQDLAQAQKPESLGVTVTRFGGFSSAERCVMGFSPDGPVKGSDFPVDCIQISPTSEKFAQTLSHRDYLGAVLNLGIERQVTGDILVEDKMAYLFCLSKVSDYICEYLEQVSHTKVKAEKITSPERLPSLRFSQKTGSVASVRLDSLLSLAFGQSRSSLVGEIEQGQVFVNGRLITSPAFTPKENDLISVRHKGKFRFDEIGQRSKKGRIYVTISKYE